MPRKFVSGLGLLLAALWPVPSEAALHGCFERVYDAEHMAKNPAQFIRAIQVQVGLVMGRDGGSEEDQDIIAIKTTRDKKLYYIGLKCELGDGPRNCTTTREGERMTIEETGKGLKLTFDSAIRADEEGMGGDAGLDIPQGFDNGVFAVPQVSDTHCSYFLNR
jgi:hypothetical protein